MRNFYFRDMKREGSLEALFPFQETTDGGN